MSRVYVFTRTAIHDLELILDHLAVVSSINRSEDFLNRLNQLCSKLLAFPKMGRARHELLPNLRSFPLDDVLIFYRPTEMGIEILRVVSSYRDLRALFEDHDL
ncbi:type II toxin-antitoxin system RelE/ParE family toxin [Spirulina sp. CCNP1310]|uniref:type II toxin-antitoxin system RelE/ParE family toxin n=1 Tax=Spirulina sp. CCNP1310 TaxID=3110249 RepID=UPI002B20B741|nr:type II toxin-antitoxin system RelE/ParE family toxin [Spirulina sp. CCNP1310]MEA5420419.1 type II toxin-antitoxin system RelE/ParE family toxin [Spirulina sp. CCNP1310]